MIKINLLYRAVAEKEKKTTIARQLAVFIAIAAIFAILIASVQIFMMRSIANIEAEIKTKEDRLVVLKKVLGEIKDIIAEKETLERKLAVIKRLEEDRLYPVRLLDEVNALVLPKDIRLTKVSEQGSQLNIEGVGRDNIAVALFMKNLQLSGYIQSVDLVSSRQVALSGVNVNQFSLSCVKKRS
ncbi:MAG: PilN domain-containing protein [Candidatus Omnitrophica bacterium]|nr:PilN domain-containing protein [Candidatus Omnitrophota bacterium]